jgi:hypothetical protein
VRHGCRQKLLVTVNFHGPWGPPREASSDADVVRQVREHRGGSDVPQTNLAALEVLALR